MMLSVLALFPGVRRALQAPLWCISLSGDELLFAQAVVLPAGSATGERLRGLTDSVLVSLPRTLSSLQTAIIRTSATICIFLMGSCVWIVAIVSVITSLYFWVSARWPAYMQSSCRECFNAVQERSRRAEQALRMQAANNRTAQAQEAEV